MGRSAPGSVGHRSCITPKSEPKPALLERGRISPRGVRCVLARARRAGTAGRFKGSWRFKSSGRPARQRRRGGVARVTSPHDCVFMNEKNPRVSNRGERGWRRRPTPRAGSGPAGPAQPPGERRPERPLRSRSASPPAGGRENRAAGSGTGWRPLCCRRRRGSGPGLGLEETGRGGRPAALGTVRSSFPVHGHRPGGSRCRSSGSGSGSPARIASASSRRAPPFPPPPSSPSFLSGRSRPRPGPPSSLRGLS